MLSPGQHCRRGVEQGHLVARPGQREGLMARLAPYVQDGRRRTGEVVQELVMEHVGTDLSLYRRVRPRHELVGQSCPRVAVHGNPSWHRPRIARGTAGRPWPRLADLARAQRRRLCATARRAVAARVAASWTVWSPRITPATRPFWPAYGNAGADGQGDRILCDARPWYAVVRRGIARYADLM